MVLLGALAGAIGLGSATAPGALGRARPQPRATAAVVGLPPAPAGQQTHPRVTPATGGTRTHFVLALRLRDQPGHTGVLATDYQVRLATPGCVAPQPAAIETGTAGTVVRVRLIAPAGGWCLGRYRVKILLERGPYCPRPAPGQPPRTCPLFATQALDVGDTGFVVHKPRRA